MSYTIKINQVQASKVSEVDINNIAMGNAFTDHMFICDYENGAWINPRIEPLAAIATHPAAMALHYGQAIFEGMKATLGNDNTPLLFRPMENAKRMNFSADRMGMPSFPEDLFVEALKKLVALEKNWIPSEEGAALYLRPFMYADEAFIGMRAATRYKFIVIASPAGPFFSKPIKLYAETKYIRAAVGGTGEAKAAGNYAGAIRPTEMAKAKGYDQVLWLDANNFEYIQEVGTMNVFFKIGGKFITPDLSGSILAGITRMSVIDLLRDKGFEVTERPITISEIIEASQNGTLEEAFGAGTAVGIAMIEEIGYKDSKLMLPKENPVSHDVNDSLNAIKTQKAEDKFGWIVPAV
ncbi:branched-chain amino acid aminotransferase/4-amino-4-deoxychorismate lyase family protein [Flavobacterium limnosediminis JC2902]|uniref:Branched-chain-amino-acid aminotransferase n=1 Tax=Flavobacterium limnosediminis JC2902 TaxID=1341181 RepID=V6SRI9_9FLAO|nr:branched-chain amino acid aminotransferase [Flavobacterium limnosediminis]ESU29318.1 branched-chain amino acid aminotransferase/4-amino-4-deoxychorismate lyase family protein [Flavobacterium limnosediminis JC2902]